MIVGYMRVSTDKQDMALQMDALKEAGCDKIFSDVMSGAKTERPGLTECLKFLQRGDTLVTWKLDRVGRNLRHLVNVVHDLNDRGVGFKVLTGQGASIDTTTAAGKLIFGIFASLAEFERELIRERVNAGIKAAKARGVRFGAKRKITPSILEQARQIRETSSVRLAAKTLGISKSALYRELGAA
jgi:DNA invertase Pin-like site-specific DNA recombinase